MATYYADFDLGTGDNDGTSWANAWRTMADAIAGSNGTAPAAGDTVYCRGTDTLSSSPTNALSGDETNGLIKWIGVNGAGNNDGTRAILDANSNDVAPLTINGNYNLYENFGFTGSGNSSGVAGTGDYNVWINCAFYSNAQNGYGTYGGYDWFIRCVAYGNGWNGYSIGISSHILFCRARGHTSSGYAGFYLHSGAESVMIGCIASGNNIGFGNVSTCSLLFGCIADGNEDDGFIARSTTIYNIGVIGCRITNQSGSGDIGLNCNNEIVLYGWNYISNNADTIANDAISYALTYNGAATNTLSADGASAGDTDEGYTAGSPYDYNLRSDATLRRTAITVPYD